jgi:glutamate carboxypeptidase
LVGPGVADAKGGLVVMLAALEAFEKSRGGDALGWTVMLNPDEEIGSIGSAPRLRELAEAADVGLIFEPALPDGGLITQRKGSGNFTVVTYGRSAHAGRNIDDGRNAVAALCRLLVEIEGLHKPALGVMVNLGEVVGGGPLNVVPDRAVGRFNARVDSEETMRAFESDLRCVVERHDGQDGLRVELSGGFHSPPKLLDEKTRRLLDLALESAAKLGLGALPTHASGGSCDGNKIAAVGLPALDTLGPVGGAIHSHDEYLVTRSLVERARLTAAVLARLAEDPAAWVRRA